MLVSKPADEKRQTSAAVVPVEGRCRGIGLPARLQLFVEVTKAPIAATSRSKLASEVSMPAVVRSTTVMSLPLDAGDPLVRVITLSVLLGATTFSCTTFEKVLSGFSI